MTNSEAVEYAIKFLEQDYAPIEVLKKLKDVISALEENDKLKSEIEELNKKLDTKETLLNLQEVTMSMLSSDKDTFIHKYQDATKEIKQLKSELEQGIRNLKEQGIL